MFKEDQLENVGKEKKTAGKTIFQTTFLKPRNACPASLLSPIWKSRASYTPEDIKAMDYS